MKRLITAILLSLLTHLLAAGILLRIRVAPLIPVQKPLSLVMICAQADTPAGEPDRAHEPQTGPESAPVQRSEPPGKPAAPAMNPADLPDPAWNAFLRESKNREMILPDHFTAAEKERALNERFGEWLSKTAKEGYRDLAREDADRMMNKRSTGTEIMKAPSGILNPFIGRLKKRTEPSFDFIPTRTQTEALAHLFHTKKATQIELYGAVVEGGCTLEGLIDELDRLVSKGFVDKKKISPQLILSINTPVASIPIEMSRKNRLNPLYEYEITIDRTTLMHYLQSRLTSLEDRYGSAPDTTSGEKRRNNLKKLMEILAQEPESR